MSARCRILALIAMSLAAVPNLSPLQAEDSNRNAVREELSKDGWNVVWGKNFTEGDWVQGTAAIAESIAQENPGPFLNWFGNVMQENYSKIESNVPGVAQNDIRNWILQSLKGRQIVQYKDFQIDAGFATYNRWQAIKYDVPDGIEYMGINSKIKYKTVEKDIPLPNWHQFFVRYRFNQQGNDKTEPSGTDSHQRVLFHIRNAWIFDQNGKRADELINVEQGPVVATPILPGWQSAMWVFEPIKIPNDNRTYYRIKNFWRRDHYLHIENGRLECTPIKMQWYSAFWALELSPTYKMQRIRNVWKPAIFLNTQAGQLRASEVEPGWLSACWILERLQ